MKLLTFDEAKRIVENNFKSLFLGEEEVVLLEAYNRVLSEDVISPLDFPNFNTSRLNGYAIKAQETSIANEEEPINFKVIGVITVGEQSPLALAQNEAFEVSAGAVLPAGADTVVDAQSVEREDDCLRIYTSLSTGENIRKVGSDIIKGAIVLKKGQVLGSSEVGVIASLGFKQVRVFKYPIVAVISIGDEINELSKPLLPGKNFDVNGYSLSTAIMECGSKAAYFGAVSSDKSAIQRILQLAVSSADMLVVCSSVDISDSVDLLGQPGIVVDGIAIKPGKNMAIAFVKEKPIFLLPPNPSAALIMFQLFARPILQRLCGRPITDLKVVKALLGSRLFSAKGMRTYTLVKLTFDDQCRLIADPIDSLGEIHDLVDSDGFVKVPENDQYIDVNQEVTVHLLKGLAGKA